mmetsp:Transcript_8525/g.8426  ORF Transcript_8525/g.8426 Transcript_8525/m.8426 type:complete len:92 (-) Transcript_8525:260-535(-)
MGVSDLLLVFESGVGLGVSFGDADMLAELVVAEIFGTDPGPLGVPTCDPLFAFAAGSDSKKLAGKLSKSMSSGSPSLGKEASKFSGPNSPS